MVRDYTYTWFCWVFQTIGTHVGCRTQWNEKGMWKYLAEAWYPGVVIWWGDVASHRVDKLQPVLGGSALQSPVWHSSEPCDSSSGMYYSRCCLIVTSNSPLCLACTAQTQRASAEPAGNSPLRTMWNPTSGHQSISLSCRAVRLVVLTVKQCARVIVFVNTVHTKTWSNVIYVYDTGSMLSTDLQSHSPELPAFQRGYYRNS